MDGDCLILTDLNEMYNLDFNNNYILGFYDVISNGVDYLGLKTNIYINCGVILLNLKKLRDDNKTINLVKMTESKMILKNVDQTVLNYFLYPNIGRLPSRYGIFNFEDDSDLEVYLNILRTKIPIEELKNSLNNPAIIHFVWCYPKPWYNNSSYIPNYTFCKERNNCSCEKYHDIWHSFAKKTDYYDKIKNLTIYKKRKIL